MMYLLPWDQLTPNLWVTREALSSIRPIIGRMEFQYGAWHGKISVTAGEKYFYIPASYGFQSVICGYDRASVEGIMSLILTERNCKLINPKHLVMI